MTASRRSYRGPVRNDRPTRPVRAPRFQGKLPFSQAWNEFPLVVPLRVVIGGIIHFGSTGLLFRLTRTRARGQSVLEFALVLPILLVLLGGAVQYGVIFAAQNSLTQVARDTARWAATQSTYIPCSDAAGGTLPPLLDQADQIAQASSLIGYTAVMWKPANFTTYPYPDSSPLPANTKVEGVEVAWSWEPGGQCPPIDNTTAAYVTIRVTHAVPIFLPGLQYLPSLGSCDATGCYISLSATSKFRMEPPRQ